MGTYLETFGNSETSLKYLKEVFNETLTFKVVMPSLEEYNGKVFILAGSHIQMKYCLGRLFNLNPAKGIYINSLTKLYGLSDITLYLYGTFWKTNLWKQENIPDYCKTHGIKLKLINDEGKICEF